MIDIASVDWELFNLAKVGRGVKLLYNKQPVQFCTSNLYTPFGVRSNQKEWSNFTDYTLECSLNQANNESSATFREFIDKLDECVSQLVRANLGMFTNVQSGTDLVYSPILKENGNYPKLMRLQLPRDKNGNFECFVFDNQKEKIKINDTNITEVLSKGKVFKCIIECSKVWIYNGRIGSMWNIVQLKFAENKMNVQSKPDQIYTQLMIE